MDIQLLIPQRDPIIMVDKVTSHSKDNTDTLFTINKNNIFVVDNIFQSSGVIEHIAQSAAASMGRETIESGNKPLLGYIASIKNLIIHDLPKVGSVIKTKIIITN
jgi:predicted hotdog family 3-hydroxylacyl-ACP dehydratase